MDSEDEQMEIIDDLILLNLWITFMATGCLLMRKYSNRRRWWIRPTNQNARLSRGHYFNLFLVMKHNDPEQFFVYTRMTPVQFNKLLRMVRPYLIKNSYRAIRPEERLAMTLRYLSQGGTMQAVVWDYGVGKSTVSCVIKETCEALWLALSPTYLKAPDKSKWAKIAKGFHSRWNLPNCLGAVDGKLISMQCPKLSGSLYYSYKKIHAMILMAVCDHNYRFTMVDIGGYGSQGDRAIFRESQFGQAILNGTLDVPGPQNLPGSEINMPHFFVGDEAFPLRTNLMRPYPGKYLDEERRIFNYRLSRARRTIENTFGILAARWRIFRGNINADIRTVEAIVKATVCLHNFLRTAEVEAPGHQRRYCPSNYIDRENEAGEIIPGEWRVDVGNCVMRNISRTSTNNLTANAANLRDMLKQYLSTPEGEVEWQYRYVNRGYVAP